MKTLTKNNLSLYIFDDNEIVQLNDNQTIVGDPVKFFILDCNNSNTVLHENTTPPEDWYGHKYFFDGKSWTLNPDFSLPKSK